jgi:hypothetical protein
MTQILQRPLDSSVAPGPILLGHAQDQFSDFTGYAGLFRFTKIWEKIIVIIESGWTERIVIGQDMVEPKLA